MTLDLPAGEYVVFSTSALEYENEQYSWEHVFTIRGGQTSSVELSNDNARIEIATDVAHEVRVEMDEGNLYQAVRARVFKILSDFGHGSGFLVDVGRGLIATNHHVVGESEYLAVKVEPELKYAVRVVAEDTVNDIAILQVHPSAVEHLEAVRLAEDRPDSPPCEVGDRVVAIGSPLATETILTSGLVSKIERDAIYSDVSINPGNSGGPLFDARRQVIGINTFGLASAGPGIAGVIRVHLIHDLLAEARRFDLDDPPDPALLPVAATFRFPAEAIREAALSRTFRVADYHVEAGKFDIQIVTPVLVAGLQVADEKGAVLSREKRNKKKQDTKAYTPGKDFYEWRKYAGDYRAVVTIQAVPEIKMTGGSMFATVMLGGGAGQKYKFKADFDRMELWRGDSIVRPIHPRRWSSVVAFRQGTAVMQDVVFYGSYEYPPEAFRPGATLTLKVWKQGDSKPIVKTIAPEQLLRVSRDFEPYFEALEATVAGELPAG